jgi:hypothetical protein
VWSTFGSLDKGSSAYRLTAHHEPITPVSRHSAVLNRRVQQGSVDLAQSGMWLLQLSQQTNRLAPDDKLTPGDTLAAEARSNPFRFAVDLS